MPVGRYAPSTTGHAHPGTLLAALLAWCDARRLGGRVILRLEDIDAERSTAHLATAMQDELAWLGLDWDEVYTQSARTGAHAEALDVLARRGLVYPCSCSRAAVKQAGRLAADGGPVYPGTCRGRRLPSGGWRSSEEPLRLRLPDEPVDVRDEGGGDLSQALGLAMGDPVVRRRGGAFAYQLAVVVDDAAAGVTRVVRGRDIAPSTATQVAVQRYLGLPTPVYRHHFLLLEPRGDKLAKLHGSVGAPELRQVYSAPELVGLLAHVAGLSPRPEPARPADVLAAFDWRKVREDDVVVRWTGERLQV